MKKISYLAALSVCFLPLMSSGTPLALSSPHTHDNHVYIQGGAGVSVTQFTAEGHIITDSQPYKSEHTSQAVNQLDIDIVAGRHQSPPVAQEFYDAVSAYTSMYGHEDWANFDVWGSLVVNGHSIEGIHVMQGSFGEPGNPWIIGAAGATDYNGDIVVHDDSDQEYFIHQSGPRTFTISKSS